MINNSNQMEIKKIQGAPNDMLEAFEDAFANMKIGGKRRTIKNRRYRRKSRRTRKYEFISFFKKLKYV